MGFSDTGAMGVPVRPRVYSDKLPKNVAQPDLDGKKVFPIGGVNPDTFNIDADLFKKITGCEYFKCLYVFKTFDKVVDVIYEKVSYVEPFTHRGQMRRGMQKQPSSAFCLLLKLFHLRLTEEQVKILLDHPDSTYLRVMGMLYVRYGGDPTRWWKWLGEYVDDLEEFSPGIQVQNSTTVGAFAKKLLTPGDNEFFETQLPRISPEMEYRMSVHLAKHEDMARRGLKNLGKVDTPALAVGASGFLCCARDFYAEDVDPEAELQVQWRQDATVKAVEEPYKGAPEGTQPRYEVVFKDGETAWAKSRRRK